MSFATVSCLQDGKIYTFEELSDSSSALLSQRHSEMRDVGKDIGKLLSSSNRMLKASKASPAWRAYVDYVSDIVIQGFSKAITTSTHHLLLQLDPEVLARWALHSPAAPRLVVVLLQAFWLRCTPAIASWHCVCRQ
jgi:hypothetical protein